MRSFLNSQAIVFSLFVVSGCSGGKASKQVTDGRTETAICDASSGTCARQGDPEESSPSFKAFELNYPKTITAGQEFKVSWTSVEGAVYQLAVGRDSACKDWIVTLPNRKTTEETLVINETGEIYLCLSATLNGETIPAKNSGAKLVLASATASNSAPIITYGSYLNLQNFSGSGTSASPFSFDISEDSSTGEVSFVLNDSDSSSLQLICEGDSAFLSVDNANSKIIFAPLQEHVGAHSFSCHVSDGQTSSAASINFVATIINVNDVPLFTYSSNANLGSWSGTGSVGDPYYFVLSQGSTDGEVVFGISDEDGDSPNIQCSGVTSFLSIDNPNDKITFAPLQAHVGASQSFNCKANDGTADSTIIYFSVDVSDVNDAPAVAHNTHSNLTGWNGSGSIGDPYTFSINEDTTNGEVTFTINDIDGDTPNIQCSGATSFLSIDDANDKIVFSPLQANVGTGHAFNCKVNDGMIDSTQIIYFSVDVINVNDAPTISHLSHANVSSWAGSGTSGDPYTFSLDEDSNDGEVAFSIDDEDGGLPSIVCTGTTGMFSIDNDNDQINFATTQADVASGIAFECHSNDGVADSAGSIYFAVDILEQPDLPVWGSTIANFSNAPNSPLSGIFALANDEDPGQTPSYSLDTANMTCDTIGSWSPAVSINAGTGELTGTPTDGGECTIKIVATSNGDSISQTFTVSLYNDPPVDFCDAGTLSDTCTITSTKTLANWVMVSGSGNVVIGGSGQVNTSNKDRAFFDLDGDYTIETGGTSTGNFSIEVNNFNIESSATLSAQGRGEIGVASATGNGSGPGIGPGNCYGGYIAGSGGGHGGVGGVSNYAGGSTYGSSSSPTTFGSAGGGGSCSTGGAGGGTIKIISIGTATINGTISANGLQGSDPGGGYDNGAGGGGAGGSIWINATTVAGAGLISANGGAGGFSTPNAAGGGGGAGGRIALFSAGSFGGTISVNGGALSEGSSGVGGTGSLHLNIANPCTSGSLDATCTISVATPIGDNQTWSGTGSIVVTSTGSIINGAGTPIIDVDGDFTVQAGGSVSANFATLDVNNFTIENTATFTGNVSTLLVANAFDVSGSLNGNINVLTITGSGLVNGSMTGNYAAISASNFEISSSGTILANGKGEVGVYRSSGNGTGAGTGPGNCYGAYIGGSGAGHGGTGGASSYSGGISYGSSTSPTTYGSSGGGGSCSTGGAGGGAVKITSTGLVTIDGTISANGLQGTDPVSGYDNGAGGGGAGGSIWIDAANISGSGIIHAKGGQGGFSTPNAVGGGGGGGGRIALYSAGSFGGSISVNGGAASEGSSVAGSTGSLYLNITNPCNSGSLNSTCMISTATAIGDNQAWNGTGSIIITSAGSLYNEAGSPDINIDGDFTVQAGGSVSANFATLDVNNFTIENTATFVGNIASLLVANDVEIAGTFNGKIDSFLVAGNATVSGTMIGNYPNITSTNFELTSSGILSANGMGEIGVYRSTGIGPGAGSGPGNCNGGYVAGSGGGHGGAGGVASYAGGSAFGFSYSPISFGSSGGGGSCSTGGAGGGAIKILASSTITIDGTVSANGQQGTDPMSGYDNGAGGGGGGGSIWLDASILTGTGNIFAKGGQGGFSTPNTSGGGGGGGGRIAAYYDTDTFTGSGSALASGGPASEGSSGAGVDGSNFWSLKSAAQPARHLIFVSSSTHNGNYSSLTSMDSFCQTKAINSSLAGKWKAVASGSGSDVSNRLNLVGRIHNLNNELVASDDTEFWSGSFTNPINYNESKVNPGSVQVWSGSFSNGSEAADHCLSWTSSNSGENGRYGLSDSVDGTWIDSGSLACNQSLRLYCIMQ